MTKRCQLTRVSLRQCRGVPWREGFLQPSGAPSNLITTTPGATPTPRFRGWHLPTCREREGRGRWCFHRESEIQRLCLMSNSSQINNYLQRAFRGHNQLFFFYSAIPTSSQPRLPKEPKRSSRAESRGNTERVTSLGKAPAAPGAAGAAPCPSGTGAILLDDAVHAGAVADVCHGVAAEVPGAAVPGLLVEAVRAAVPRVVGQSRHAAVR